MASTRSRGELPSSKWLSFDGWDYDGMKERLEKALKTINKIALVAHAEHIIGHKLTMSEPFSAGQYRICFELVAENGTLVIARVRLPRHPDAPQTFTDEDMAFATECEVATMRYVREKLASISTPCVYTYESGDSVRANEAGAAYMLIEGFRGNTLLDVEYDMTRLPVRWELSFLAKFANTKKDVCAKAHHDAVDKSPSRARNPDLALDRLNLIAVADREAHDGQCCLGVGRRIQRQRPFP